MYIHLTQQHFFENIIHSPLLFKSNWCCISSVQIWLYFFLRLLFCSIYLFILVLLSHCLNYAQSVSLSVLFLLKMDLIILGFWHLPIKFRISLPFPTTEMSPRIFDWGYFKSKSQFGDNWYLYSIESASTLKCFIPLCLLYLWLYVCLCLSHSCLFSIFRCSCKN